MTRRSIWIGIGVFLLAMLATIEPSNRSVALSDISLGGSSAQAKQHKWNWHHHHRPHTPPILDALEDLDLDADDDGPDDDDAGSDDDDNGPDDDSDDD